MADVHKSLRFAAHAAIVLGIAYTVAQATWFFVSGRAQMPLRANSALPAAAERPEPLPIEQLAAQHLFGRPAANAKPASVADTETLRETRLSLELVGVFVADDADSSTALIARKGKPAESFAIGDRLPGNAKLTAVYRDRVVITRGESKELIVFDKPTEWIASVSNTQQALVNSPAGLENPPRDQSDSLPMPNQAAAVAESAAASGAPGTVRQALRQRWEQLRTDPRQAIEELGLVAEDGAPGYALGAVAERPELSHVGLQQGDRILSVNGRPVGDAEADGFGVEIERLLALDSASLEIQRGQRRFFVTVALD